MFYIDRPLNFIAFGFLTSVKMKQKTSVCFFFKIGISFRVGFNY